MALTRRQVCLGGGAVLLFAVVGWAWQPGLKGPCFTVGERLRLFGRANWPGSISKTNLAARASLTPEASIWLDAYVRAKRAPGVRAEIWDAWLRQRLDCDWSAARADVAGGPVSATAPPVPSEIVRTVGAPPALAKAVRPVEYRLDLSESVVGQITLRDHPELGERFRWYRHADGVMETGTPVSQLVDGGFRLLGEKSGLTRSQLRTWTAVSALEGGFDAVNTYDTGNVSAGFLQFTSGVDGSGSLMQVLREEKESNPVEFCRDFESFGIEVDRQGVLHVVDPRDGRERSGAEAVRCVVREPRLAAVFVLAGRRSAQFRSAQLGVAIRRFYPSGDPLSVKLNSGKVLTGSVSDAVHSEAGMATLLDGKINTGSIGDEFGKAVQGVVTQFNLQTWSDISRFERVFIVASKHRTNFLADVRLSQPPLALGSVKGL